MAVLHTFDDGKSRLVFQNHKIPVYSVDRKLGTAPHVEWRSAFWTDDIDVLRMAVEQNYISFDMYQIAKDHHASRKAKRS